MSDLRRIDDQRYGSDSAALAGDLVDHRKWIREELSSVMRVFLRVNLILLAAVVGGWGWETYFILRGWMTSGDRTFTGQVFIALIGASVVQLGALALFVGQTLVKSLHGERPRT